MPFLVSFLAGLQSSTPASLGVEDEYSFESVPRDSYLGTFRLRSTFSAGIRPGAALNQRLESDMAQFAAFFGDRVDANAAKGLGDDFAANLAAYRQVHETHRRIRGSNMTDWRWVESCLQACRKIYRSFQAPPIEYHSKDCAELINLMLEHRNLSNQMAALRVMAVMRALNRSGQQLCSPEEEAKTITNLRIDISRIRDCNTATAPTARQLALLGPLETALDLWPGALTCARDVLLLKAHHQRVDAATQQVKGGTRQPPRICGPKYVRSLSERAWPAKLQGQVAELFLHVESQHSATIDTPLYRPATKLLRKETLGRLFAAIVSKHAVPADDLVLELVVNPIYWQSALEREKTLSRGNRENSSVKNYRWLERMLFRDPDAWIYSQHHALDYPMLAETVERHCAAADVCRKSEPTRAWAEVIKGVSAEISGAIDTAIARANKRSDREYHSARGLVAGVINLPHLELIASHLLTCLRDRRVYWCDETSASWSYHYSLMLLTVIYGLSTKELANIIISPESLHVDENDGSISLKIRNKNGVLTHSYRFVRATTSARFDAHEALTHTLGMRARFLARLERESTPYFFTPLLDCDRTAGLDETRSRMLEKWCLKITADTLPGVFDRPLGLESWRKIAQKILSRESDNRQSVVADISPTRAHGQVANKLQSLLG